MIAGCRAKLVAREGSAGQRLVMASALGSVFAVRSLLAEGVEVNFVDEAGNIALITAACWGLDVSELVLGAGANVNLLNKNADSALILAAMNGHVLVVRILLAASANPNHANKHGNTALLLAADKNHPEVVKLHLALTSTMSAAATLSFMRNQGPL